MIKGITAGSHIKIENGHPSMPSFYANIGKELVGQVKYNSSSQSLEVWDGSSWQCIVGAFPTVSLTPEAQRAMTWIIERMAQEELMADHKHPAMKAAYENLQRARQHLEATAILVKEDYNNEQSTS
jgi:hypothetical protein